MCVSLKYFTVSNASLASILYTDVPEEINFQANFWIYWMLSHEISKEGDIL